VESAGASLSATQRVCIRRDGAKWNGAPAARRGGGRRPTEPDRDPPARIFLTGAV